jgi:predicted transposase YbfD/YdcC
MEEDIRDTFLDYFGDIDDPRSRRNRLYPLSEILFAVFCACVSGADSWEEIESFGKTHEDFLKKYLPYENGIPSDDTFRRLFRALNPQIFQEKFRDWVSNYFPRLADNIIAIDGKSSRGSADGKGDDRRALHMVSAYATEANLVLAQEKVADKSNEIKAIPQLLEWLDLRGATVTIDAMGCQYKIADQIVEKEGRYVLALKGNQSSLHDDVKTAFQDSEFAEKCDIFETNEKGHGRVETRKCSVLSDTEWLRETHPNWKTINAVVRIDSKREIGEKISEETRYYVSSNVVSAAKMLSIVRSHWGIENSVHWILDMSFGEDQSKIRQKNAPQNMAIVRHIALNLLKMTKNNIARYKRVAIKRLRKMAGWNNDVLLDILSQIFS